MGYHLEDLWDECFSKEKIETVEKFIEICEGCTSDTRKEDRLIQLIAKMLNVIHPAPLKAVEEVLLSPYGFSYDGLFIMGVNEFGVKEAVGFLPEFNALLIHGPFGEENDD